MKNINLQNKWFPHQSWTTFLLVKLCECIYINYKYTLKFLLLVAIVSLCIWTDTEYIYFNSENSCHIFHDINLGSIQT